MTALGFRMDPFGYRLRSDRGIAAFFSEVLSSSGRSTFQGLTALIKRGDERANRWKLPYHPWISDLSSSQGLAALWPWCRLGHSGTGDHHGHRLRRSSGCTEPNRPWAEDLRCWCQRTGSAAERNQPGRRHDPVRLSDRLPFFSEAALARLAERPRTEGGLAECLATPQTGADIPANIFRFFVDDEMCGMYRVGNMGNMDNVRWA